MKIKIEKGSEAEKSIKPLLDKMQQRQDEFREAVQQGKLEEYAEKERFAQPVSVPKP